jgi:site-specific recombinase XerD
VSSEDNGGGNSTVEELLEVWSNAAQQKLVAFGVASLLLPPAPAQTQVRPTTAGLAASAKGKAKGSGKGKQKDPEPNQPQPPPPLLPQKPKRATRSLKPAKPKLEILDDSPGTLPKDLDVAAGTELFLATLAGKSKETARTYRTGCRRFWTFLYETGRGVPDRTPITALPPTILERYYEWLLGRYGNGGSAGGGGGGGSQSGTVGGYMAAARVLFEYFASRGITPGNVQYQQLVARLKKMQGRSAGYRTPRTLRTKGNLPRIEQLARLTISQLPHQQQGQDNDVTPTTTSGSGTNGGQDVVDTAIMEAAADKKTTGLGNKSGNSGTGTGSTTDAKAKVKAKAKNDVTPDETKPGSPVKSRQRQKQPRPIAAGRRKNHEAEEARQHLEEVRNRAIVLTLYTTGMRRHEVAALNRTDLEDILALHTQHHQSAHLASRGNFAQGNITTEQGNMGQGNITTEQGNIAQGNITTEQGNFERERQGNMGQGNIEQHRDEHENGNGNGQSYPMPDATFLTDTTSNPNPNSNKITLPEVTSADVEAEAEIYELIIRGKGNKERIAYFDGVALAAITSYLDLRGKDGYRPLFIQHHRGRDRVEPGEDGENYRVSVDMLGKAVTKFALEKLGVKIRPHDFRHNLATTLLNAGAKLEEVQDILGHSSPVTTKLIYAHYSKTHLRDVFARYRGK